MTIHVISSDSHRFLKHLQETSLFDREKLVILFLFCEQRPSRKPREAREFAEGSHVVKGIETHKGRTHKDKTLPQPLLPLP